MGKHIDNKTKHNTQHITHTHMTHTHDISQKHKHNNYTRHIEDHYGET